jgi:hypothetical protein
MRRHAWSVIAPAAALAFVFGSYAARHLAIDTDINRLISPDLPWRRQELAFSRAFPQRNGISEFEEIRSSNIAKS